MKIREDKKYTSIDQMEVGTVFIDDEKEYYILTEELEDRNNQSVNCIRLSDGEAFYMSSFDKVQEVECELVIKG